jgi:hypothetical protein
MAKVIYPISAQAGREGEVADVIHDIAVEIMEHRADLIRYATRVPKSESRIFRKQARLLEEYAAALDAIYYQMEPMRWNPEVSRELLDLTQLHNITIPEWMFPARMKPNEPLSAELSIDTTANAVNLLKMKVDELSDPMYIYNQQSHQEP